MTFLRISMISPPRSSRSAFSGKNLSYYINEYISREVSLFRGTRASVPGPLQTSRQNKSLFRHCSSSCRRWNPVLDRFLYSWSCVSSCYITSSREIYSHIVTPQVLEAVEHRVPATAGAVTMFYKISPCAPLCRCLLVVVACCVLLACS